MVRLLILIFIFASSAQAREQQWFIDNIHLYEAWKIINHAPEVRVGIIDMDFDLNHPDLKNDFDLQLSKDFTGFKFKNISEWGSALEHGTMVSGIINNVAQTRLLALNFSPQNRKLSEIFKYAVDSGVKVINCSNVIQDPSAAQLEDLRDGIQYAADHGVVVVTAAGNFGVDNDKGEYFPANFSREFDNVITVGASTAHNDVWSHSQFGVKTVDVFAPGEDILVTAKAGVYLRSEGTSEAAPVVTGVIALMLQVNPLLRASDIKNIIRVTSEKFPVFAGRCASGGRIDAKAAVEAAKRF